MMNYNIYNFIDIFFDAYFLYLIFKELTFLELTTVTGFFLKKTIVYYVEFHTR